jgi:hypothetical protein
MPIIRFNSSPVRKVIKSQVIPDELPSTDPDSPNYTEPKYVRVSDLSLLEPEPKVVESGISAIEVFAPAVPLEELEETIHEHSDDCMVDDHSDEEELLENTEEVKLYDFLVAYLRINTSPSDEQFHSLALSINKDPEYLESVVYKIMALMFEDDELSEDARGLIDEALVTAEYLPAIGESEGLPDLGLDEISELTEHDGDPR